MDQTEEPVQSNTSDKEEDFGDESEERDEQYCGNKASPMVNDQGDSSQIDEHESIQVRFEKNGECVSGSGRKDAKNLLASEVEEEENETPETNGLNDEQAHEDYDEEDEQETPDTLTEYDEANKQQEEPSTELDEENYVEGKENLPTEASQRDSIVDLELSEEGIEEVEEKNEKDILQKLKNSSQYDRASSFSSLSVNIGSTQQDSDSEHQTSTRATPDSYSDICEENSDKYSIENEENYKEEERGGYCEELEINEQGSEQKETQEERETTLDESCASFLPAQEELDDNDNKPDANVTLSEEESEHEDDALNTSEHCLQSEKANEDVVEESTEQGQSREEDFDEKAGESDVEEKELPEAIENEEEKDKNDDEIEKVKHEPQPVVRDDEQTKVKKLGKIFQERENQNPTALFPKEMNQSEKSPINVRRFREIFEHGEPLLSPAAHAHVPEEECTSPRPGIVKNLRDLFENPKNFEWKETVNSTAVVN